ncbi:hypothetical protein J6590_108833 [Homalodisca vitripennis]|nr:hypothetical protein J6590_108833 [Homalodisca vitripennis]
MLIETGMPESFWAEAIVTANYIRNRCPSTCIGGKTPYEIWHGKLPDLKHMRIFGSRAYVLDKTVGLGKVDPKAAAGRFIGYDLESKAYRVRLDTGKTVVTRDVRFDENMGSSRANVDPLEESIKNKNFENQQSKIQDKPEIIYAKVELDPLEFEEEEKKIVNEQENGEIFIVRGKRVGRLPKIRTGSRGRPRKYRRPESVSSTGSSRGKDMNTGDDDVFIDDEQGRGLKRPLESSCVQVGKRHREQKDSCDSDEYNNADRHIFEELVFNADVQTDKALTGDDAELWKRAIMDEVKSHLEYGTWKVVPRPANKNVIGTRTILKNKLNTDGTERHASSHEGLLNDRDLITTIHLLRWQDSSRLELRWH